MEILVDRKKRISRMGKGVFMILGLGTLPILFMNPGQYLFGLVVCGGISYGLAAILV